MAVFGFQLMLTIIVLSLMNKLSIRYSFARWLLTKGWNLALCIFTWGFGTFGLNILSRFIHCSNGLYSYLHPSNDQLKAAIATENAAIAAANGSSSGSSSSTTNNNSKNNGKARYRHHRKDPKPDQSKPETFNVPRNITLHLDSEPLNLLNLVQLPYFTDLQWLIDFSFCSVVVYFLTELYYFLFPSRIELEYNLSIIWCLISLAFVIKVLCAITAIYFRGGDDAIGERSICIVAFCIFFLLSMVILIVDEELLEFGLTASYQSFSKNAWLLLETQGVLEQSYGPSSFLMLKFWLAVWCALIGTFFTFPGMRLARMHKDAMVYAEGNPILQFLFHFSFISPLFIILFWIKPIARNYLSIREWPNRGTLMSPESFETTRLLFILLVIVVRIGLFRRYLQSYLNIAPQKLHFMKKEHGKILNVDMQKLIARVHHYVCVASLQLLAPLLMCLFMTLLTKSTGNYQWSSYFNPSNTTYSSSIGTGNDSLSLNDTGSTLLSPLLLDNNNNGSLIFQDDLVNNQTMILLATNDTSATATNTTIIDDFVNQTIAADEVGNQSSLNDTATSDPAATTAQMTLTLLYNVFNTTVLRGVTGFMLWWVTTVWFATSTVGFIYHSYFASV